MRYNPDHDPRLGPAAPLDTLEWLILDVDGVMTDGALHMDDDGVQTKAFHSRDGHGLRLLMDHGIDVAILTGRESGVVRHRCADLGICHALQGRRDKGSAFEELVRTLDCDPARIAMIGDDLVDLPAMRRAGVAITVSDGAPEIVAASHYVTAAGGGRGAVREVAEALLRARGRWDQVLDEAWNA